jgi:hypothetical protein
MKITTELKKRKKEEEKNTNNLSVIRSKNLRSYTLTLRSLTSKTYGERNMFN